MNDLSDQALLRAYCEGSREAFDAIYRRYASRVYATAYRLMANWEDAEDTLQDVFVQLVHKASSIRSQCALSAWLYRATVNRTVDLRRRRRPNISLDVDNAQTAHVVAMESLRREARHQHGEWQNEMLRQVANYIPRLPERQAAVFVLHGFQGLSHEEIAAVVGCTEPASRASYSLACRKLREWFAESEQAETQDDKKERKA